MDNTRYTTTHRGKKDNKRKNITKRFRGGKNIRNKHTKTKIWQ